MSSNADGTAADTIALFNSLYWTNYCNVAASVLFIYDAILDFDREVGSFWTAKRTGASLLFFSNKWISMLVAVCPGLIQLATFPSDKILMILQFVPVAVFSALRTYVLSRSKILGILVCALSLAPAAANLVPYGYQPSGEVYPPFGCLLLDSVSDTLNSKYDPSNTVSWIGTNLLSGNHTVVFVARVPLIIADVILICITWAKLSSQTTLRNLRQSSLSDILLRGGIMYFVALFILNGLHLIFSVTGVADEGNIGASIVTQFTVPITAIITSRFLLELQEANQVVVRLDPDDQGNRSSNPYDSSPSFISSLGGFVNPDLSTRSDIDDDEFHAGSFPEGEA